MCPGLPRPGGNQDSSVPLLCQLAQQPVLLTTVGGQRAVLRHRTNEALGESQGSGVSLESQVTQVTHVAELRSHLQVWSCCRDGCACPGWGKVLALTLYLLALCDRGIEPTIQPGP